MKRFFALLFVLCLCVPFFAVGTVSAAEEEKRFYAELVWNPDSSFTVNVCWEGATEEDELGALRMNMTYSSEKVVCRSHELGEAMRDFSIKVGPQYVYSNPAFLVGVEINHPVTSAGVLASFVFEIAPEAIGTVNFELDVLELNRLDGSSAKADFAVENLYLELTPPCERNEDYHDTLSWQVQGEKLLRYCLFCDTLLEEKQAPALSEDPVESEGVVLTPGEALLPENAVLEVEKQEPVEETRTDTLTDAEALLQIRSAFAARLVSFESLVLLEKYAVSLTSGEDALFSGEGSVFSFDAPNGVAEGETVYGALFENGSAVEVFSETVRSGKLSFGATYEFDAVYFCRGTTVADSPVPDEAPAPDETPAPGGAEESPSDPETEGGETEDAETAEPAAFPLHWIVFGVLALAALGVTLFLVSRGKKKAE